MKKLLPFVALAGLFALLVACGNGSGGNAGYDGVDPGTLDAADPGPGTDLVDEVREDVDLDPGVDPDATDEDAQLDTAPDTAAVDPGRDYAPYEQPELHVRFDLAATPVDTPFPYDYYLDPDDGHIRLDTGAFSAELLPLMGEGKYPEQLALCKGFATYTYLAFLASAPVDPESLPATPEDTIADDSPVLLVQLGDDGTPVARVPYQIATRNFDEVEGLRHLVQLTPLRPLLADTRYALVVYDNLRALSGGTFGMAQGFAQVLDIAAPPALDAERAPLFRREVERMQSTVAALPFAQRVIAAVDFTTGNAAAQMEGVMARFADVDDPDIQVSVNLDPDGDGNPNIWTDGAAPECQMTANEMALYVGGTFQPVNFTSPKGRFEFKDGKWTVFPPKNVAFSLMVPAGAGPFPVVLLAHGIQSSPGSMCTNARDLVRRGMAVLRWELPRHGSRGGGGYDFLALDDLLRIRDNFRQGATEIASLTLLVDELHEMLTIVPEIGDPILPTFDKDHIGYLGHSLGAIIGLLGMPFSERIKVWVSNVGGVGMIHLVDLALTNQFPDLNEMFASVGVLHLGSHALWGGDGVTFTHRLLSDPYTPAHAGKCLLAQEVIDDDTVANQSAELLARGAGLPLVRPIRKAVPGLDEVDAEGTPSGLFQFGDVVHGAFTGTPSSDTEHFIREQAYYFLWRGLADGVCEIVDARPR